MGGGGALIRVCSLIRSNTVATVWKFERFLRIATNVSTLRLYC